VSANRSLLEELRDQALRDIVDLDRQVSEGELPSTAAAGLRQRYEVAAARALTELERPCEPPEEPTAARTCVARPRAIRTAYAVAAAGAVLAVTLLLPAYIGERPAGGFVTGNEAAQGATDSRSEAIPRDISTVSNADLEVVVAANPEVIDMRLALANRYVEEGDYGAAARHYTVALDQQPDNVEALAHFGWLFLQLDEVTEAVRYVDQALELDPAHQEALWFRANIELYGRSDPAAALAVLAELQQRDDLEPPVRAQVDDLVAAARERQEAGD